MGPELSLEKLGRLIVDKMAAGRLVSDAIFNQIFSERARKVARRHWTPVGVAHRAASLLTEGKPKKILDVGSGAGKFCVVGSLTTPGTFTGVERRKWLVAEARKTARRLSADRAAFFFGEMGELDWSAYEGVYLYNPFYENVEPSVRIDEKVPLGNTEFDEFIAQVGKKLSTLRTGARVVTFHGYGGKMPPNFKRIAREPWAEDFLELWVKQGRSRSSGLARPGRSHNRRTIKKG